MAPRPRKRPFTEAHTRQLGALGRAIRRLREDRHLSINALARKAGMSSGHLSLIERGYGNPRLPTLRRLAEALKTTVTQILRVTEDEEKA